MIRGQVVKFAARAPAIRSFSMAAVRRAEGDTGGVRSGGAATGDSFQRREQANENMFIRQREKEALKQLKEKLAQQRKHLDDLDSHIQELESQKAGEQ